MRRREDRSHGVKDSLGFYYKKVGKKRIPARITLVKGGSKKKQRKDTKNGVEK